MALSSIDPPKGTSYLCFVHVAPGLEGLLADELAAIVGRRAEPKAGGVELRLHLQQLQLICSVSRLAEGVRVRLKAFRAFTFEELERGLALLPFRAYLPRGAKVRVSVVCHRSRLYHSGAVRERVEKTLESVLGAKPILAAVNASEESGEVEIDEESLASGEEDPELVRLFVRLDNDEVQVSVDAVGGRLHRRGYRKMSEKASIRETLASAMVFALSGAAGPSGTLWDPFCGAGTIPIEALARARGGIVQIGRRFAFHLWPALAALDLPALERTVEPLAMSVLPGTSLCVIGSDIQPRAVRAARANLEALATQFAWQDALERAKFLEGDVLAVEPLIPEGAFVLTNPPYGHRLDADSSWAKLSELARRRPDLRPCAALVGGETKRRLPGEFRTLFQTQNGGLNVALRGLG